MSYVQNVGLFFMGLYDIVAMRQHVISSRVSLESPWERKAHTNRLNMQAVSQ